MNVIYLSNARLPTEKANGFQILKMCEAFASHGAEVTLLHPYRVQPDQTSNTSPFQYYPVASTFRIETLKGLDGIALAQRFAPLLERAGFYFQNATHALNTLWATRQSWDDPDMLFFGRDLMTLLLLLRFRRHIRGTIVYEAHSFPESKTRTVIRGLNGLDRLVTMTEALKRRFAEAGYPSDKIIVEPDAVDLQQFEVTQRRDTCRERLGLPTGRPLIGYVGRFHTMGMEKGIPDLVRAMKPLCDSLASTSPMLYCVGGPMDRVPRYQEVARKEGVSSEHLRFKARVPNSQVPYWLRAFDVVTIPSPKRPFYVHSASPMKLFEYMAAGTPIVASRLPALTEVLCEGRNAVLHEPENVNDIADKILWVLQNESSAKQMAVQAQQDVKKFTWKRRAGRILRSIGM